MIIPSDIISDAGIHSYVSNFIISGSVIIYTILIITYIYMYKKYYSIHIIYRHHIVLIIKYSNAFYLQMTD